MVGKNNVGKSTLLEAPRLFAQPASLEDRLDLLASRNEVSEAEVKAWTLRPIFSLPVACLF